MTTKVARFPSLSALPREGLGDELSPEVNTFLDLLRDNIGFEFPFYLPEGIRKIEGQAALAAYLPKVGELITVESMTLDRTIMSSDKTAAVLEFMFKAYVDGSSLRYDQTYVSVVDIRNGRVSRYRDYWNSLVVPSATGAADAVNSVLQGKACNA